MTRFVRIFLIMVLAAFAASSAAHAGNVAAMSVKMALAAIDGADMGNCQDCPGDGGDMSSCDNVCVSPILALVPTGDSGLAEAKTEAEGLAPFGVAGHTGPPDPYPPRSITLN